MGKNANRILFKIKHIKGTDNTRADTLSKKAEL